MGLKVVNDYTAAGDQKPNYSGFVVIGAGLPRTGTMSLRAALGQVTTDPHEDHYHRRCERL